MLGSKEQHYDPLPEESEGLLRNERQVLVPRRRPAWFLFAMGYFVLMVVHISVFCYQIRHQVFPSAFTKEYSTFPPTLLARDRRRTKLHSLPRWRLKHHDIANP